MLDDIRVQKMCLINKVYSVFVPQEMLYVYSPIRVGLAGQLGLAFDEVVDIINMILSCNVNVYFTFVQAFKHAREW
ncbi:hypothetical protein FOB58_001459 [Candida parapsilosis]|uniref:Uncharacterized protein n=2 Tax=Candida parapsilosis TaxID=5480 RepID=G8BBI3_CANPC|nr:uncharacterized protein CPAR2_800500 [Candida parapsilosis]KAF6051399.1 hypothetical protein FOB58_001459 [Candida parapsilosis]KAF6053104.1 hypothetical protein FOB60_003360 [Candida parapsilosis]KAF6053201.1 hypothetical protein FOB59_001483 [Candida parapsilosis]KAF6064882.1 hypothetical protein FOB61_003308 [Candida parapsilosis]CAD1810415.1 unnamed protein product [Candida parapsilosis]